MSSKGEIADPPFPFLAPRLRRLVVDVERDPASISCRSLSGKSSSCSSSSWSITVDSSNFSCCSNVGFKEGARERERDGIAGVRIAVETPEGCREDGRREAGADAMGWPWLDIEIVLWIGPRLPNIAGNSLTHRPNSVAVARELSS